jgi:hypothetical protein
MKYYEARRQQAAADAAEKGNERSVGGLRQVPSLIRRVVAYRKQPAGRQISNAGCCAGTLRLSHTGRGTDAGFSRSR